MKREKKIHWVGGMIAHRKTKKTLKGDPLCTSGYRAELIKARSQTTEKLEEVNCQNCLRILEQYEQYKNSEQNG